MKKKTAFLFFFLGLSSLLSQSVLLRETATLFFGNEIFYGLGLSLWLLFSGLGSLWAGKKRNWRKWPLFLFFFLWLFLPFFPVGLRFFSAKIFFPFLPKLSLTFLTLVLVFFLYAFPHGMLFPFFLSFSPAKKKEGKIAHGYFWETLGFFGGSLLFSFFLAETSFPLPFFLQKKTLSWRFPSLSSATNSRFHQIVLTEKEGQENFFLDGQLAFSSPADWENRKLISLFAPFLPQKTSSFLLLGNPTLVKEFAKVFPSASIFFLEEDEKLLTLEKKYLAPWGKIIQADPRHFLKSGKGKYDFIFLCFGNPQTLSANRYFTKEFFAEAKRNLSPGGILALKIFLPESYQSQEALSFTASLYLALKENYPHLEVFLPEEELVFLASPKKISFSSPNLSPFPEYFLYHWEDGRRKNFLAKISTFPAQANQDSLPSAFFYQQLFWQTMFNFFLPHFLLSLSRHFSFLAFLAILVLFLFRPFFLPKLPSSFSLGLSMAAGSFLAMVLEVALLFSFQSKVGYLYSQLALLFGFILLGMALGTKLRFLFSSPQTGLKISFWGILGIIVLFWFFLEKEIASFTLFWWTLSFFSGIFSGFLFVFLNQLYLPKEKNLGFIYAFDLFGGALGAFLGSSFLLPLFGIKNSLLFSFFLFAALFPDPGNSHRTKRTFTLPI